MRIFYIFLKCICEKKRICKSKIKKLHILLILKMKLKEYFFKGIHPQDRENARGRKQIFGSWKADE